VRRGLQAAKKGVESAFQHVWDQQDILPGSYLFFPVLAQPSWAGGGRGQGGSGGALV
jgi:hypothetical protein